MLSVNARGGIAVAVAVLARAAGADEAMLRALEALELGVLERGPVRLPVAEARDILLCDLVQR